MVEAYSGFLFHYLSRPFKEYLQLKLPLRRIRSIVNPQLERPISYPAYRYFVRQDPELLALWRNEY